MKRRLVQDDESSEEEEDMKGSSSSESQFDENNICNNIIANDNRRKISSFDFDPDRINIGSSRKTCTIAMHVGETLCFHGSVRIAVMNGCVSVFGYDVTPSSGEISLYSHIWNPSALLCIEAADNSIVNLRQSQSMLMEHKNPAIIKNDIFPSYSTNALVIDRFFPIIYENEIDSNTYMSPISILPSWERAVDTIVNAKNNKNVKPPIVLLCGPRNVGKSMFLKYITNRFLSTGIHSIGILDTDLGQCELTPPGFISYHTLTKPLLGAPHTHLNTPEYSLYYGSTTAEADPDRYINSILKVYQYIADNHNGMNGNKQPVPIIINTHGWISDLGLSMLKRIINSIRPSNIIDFSSMTNDNSHLTQYSICNIDTKMQDRLIDDTDIRYTPKPVYEQVLCYKSTSKTRSTNNSKLSAAKLRDLSLVSYFGKCQDLMNIPISFSTIPQILYTYQPYEISWDILYFYNAEVQVNPEMYLETLLLSIVGLCICQYEPSFDTVNTIPGLRILQDVPMYECIGLGIIRSIDIRQRKIYIITPVHPKVLEKVNTCLSGSIHVPSEFMYKKDYGSFIPFLTTASISTGVSRMKSRGNIKR